MNVLIDYLLSIQSFRDALIKRIALALEYPEVRAALVKSGWVEPKGGGGPIPSK
jgi:hypothetical protein